MRIAGRLEPDLHGPRVVPQDGNQPLEIFERVCDRQSPPPGLAGGRDQHFMTVLGNVDAYQNTGIGSMLELGHSRSPLRWVVRNTTIET